MKANIINRAEGNDYLQGENVTAAFVICPLLAAFNDRAGVGICLDGF